MDFYFRAVNAFIEDACVLLAVAYLLARGRMLRLLFRDRLNRWDSASLGLLLGMVGVTEEAFPGARFPYAMDSLMVAFAALAGGWRVGLVAAAAVAVGALVLPSPQGAVATLCIVSASVLMGGACRWALGARHRLTAGVAAGFLAQLMGVLIRVPLVGLRQTAGALIHALPSIPANGFGMMLLLLVVNDAQLRADSERHRAEAERAHALVTEAQLNALRARVHPHFLFNALTSIAALCVDAPARAEAAIVRLGQLMRRVLEANGTTVHGLAEEIAHVQNYLEIEQMRLGSRLSIQWRVDEGHAQIRVPSFAIQTLVENAVRHGIAPRVAPGQIVIIVRHTPRHTLLAVADNGEGITLEARRELLAVPAKRLHGLQILSQQLTLVYGPRSRLRLFSRVDVGTIAVFMVPTGDALKADELARSR